MQNWCDNSLQIRGPKERINECLNAIKGTDREGKERVIDFQRIIPMPAQLKDTEAPTASWLPFLLEYKATTYVSDTINRCRIIELVARVIREHPGLETLEPEAAYKEVAELVKQKHPDWEQKYSELQLLLDQTGHSNWYDWCCENWGTKWNATNGAVEENDDEVQLDFGTAWSPPLPVVKALGKMYPDLKFTLHYRESWHPLKSGRGRTRWLEIDGGELRRDEYSDYHEELNDKD